MILGDSERQVAEKFGEAARTYADNPDRPSFARDEHALRGFEALELHHRHRAVDCGRNDAARRRADDSDARQRYWACECAAGGGGGAVRMKRWALSPSTVFTAHYLATRWTRI